MSAQKQIKFVSEAEYWAGEEISPTKHEYFQGRVYAMAGGGYNHATVCNNVSTAAENALEGRDCQALGGEMRVKVEETGLNTYPDALIFCPPARFEGSNDHTLLTPKVIFEVLSNSTASYDRGDKFENYQKIGTLTDYVLIDPNRVKIDHFERKIGGWFLKTYTQLSEELDLQSVGIQIPLSMIYRRLVFSEVTSTELRTDESN